VRLRNLSLSILSILVTAPMQGQGQEIPAERKTGDVATFDLPGGATIEMVWIRPGICTMGEGEERRKVTISRGFWLGKYELTQEQWESVMGTRPWAYRRRVVRKQPNHPAVEISWNDVQKLIRRLTEAEGVPVYRLPTNAEWEYACRAGTSTKWSFGDDVSQLGEYAWYKVNTGNAGEPYAHAVGMKRPNPWGLYDMHGNVAEWCQDGYGPYSSGSQVDPTVPGSGIYRVVRGGSIEDFGLGVRSGYRLRVLPSGRSHFIGVRLVRQEPK
jgi:formylglycine-generating enzyme required for sulfatase activity